VPDSDAGRPRSRCHSSGWVFGSLAGKDDPNAARFEKFGKEQVRAGFPLLYEVTTVRLDSILGAMVRRFIKHHTAGRIAKRPKEKKLYGVDRHERRLERIGYGGSIPPEVRRALMELSASRDVIVHQLGRVDDQFVRSCPWLNLNAGDKVRIDNPKFVSFQKACSWYALELSLRELQDGDVDARESREKLLKAQVSIMEA
jgi:hypothetical protein